MMKEELRGKSILYLSRPDERPELLKAMTGAAPTTEPYCRFLYELAGDMRPTIALETGTDQGRSAAHLALGCSTSTVYTVDIEPVCTKNAQDLKLKNIIAVTADSLEYAKSIPDGWIDLLFLDSLHSPEHLGAEWKAFRPKVRPGGIALFDDIALNGWMAKFWEKLEGEKVDLHELHYSGFGAVLL